MKRYYTSGSIVIPFEFDDIMADCYENAVMEAVNRVDPNGALTEMLYDIEDEEVTEIEDHDSFNPYDFF